MKEKLMLINKSVLSPMKILLYSLAVFSLTHLAVAADKMALIDAEISQRLSPEQKAA